jgi:hypothetical protein
MPTATTERATINLEEAAARLGVGRSAIYAEAARTGSIIGVPILCVGRRKLLSRAQLEAVLAGQATEERSATT